MTKTKKQVDTENVLINNGWDEIVKKELELEALYKEKIQSGAKKLLKLKKQAKIQGLNAAKNKIQIASLKAALQIAEKQNTVLQNNKSKCCEVIEQVCEQVLAHEIKNKRYLKATLTRTLNKIGKNELTVITNSSDFDYLSSEFPDLKFEHQDNILAGTLAIQSNDGQYLLNWKNHFEKIMMELK